MQIIDDKDDEVSLAKQRFLDLAKEIIEFANSINKANCGNAIIKYPGFLAALKHNIEKFNQLLKI